jgi:outer membrane protein OmpA-like peptidoglycan-associated protein
MKLLLILLHLLIFPVYLTAQQVLIDEKFKGEGSILQPEKSSEINKKNTKNGFEIDNYTDAFKLSPFEIKGLDVDNDDFEMEVWLTHLSGSDKFGYGLKWSGNDKRKNYVAVTANQNYKVSYYENSQWYDFVKWTFDKDLVKPSNSMNKIKVIKIGHHFQILLNDKLIYQNGFNYYFGSDFAICVQDIMKVQVNNIKVIKYESKPINLVKDIDTSLKLENIGEEWNGTYDKTQPVISPDGKTLYCINWNDPTNVGGKDDANDVMYSTLGSDGKWGPLKNIGRPINNKSSNFVIACSPDNNMLVLANQYDVNGESNGGGMSISLRNSDGNFSIPVNQVIKNYKNKSEYVSYFIPTNNKTLLLGIESDKGFGDQDLHVSFLNNDNTWSEPLNMGNIINSAGPDATPFLAADGKTLFFSSAGHKGFGGYDIFVSRRLDDSWTNWSVPENLGPNINTWASEIGYFMSAKGDYAYLSSNGDIHRIKNQAAIDPVILLSGKVLNNVTKKPMAAQIKYYDLTENKELGIAVSDEINGEFKIVLQKGKKYSFLAEKNGFYAVSESIDLKDLKEYKEINRDLFLNPVEKGQAIRLNNLFFEVNKSVLMPESYAELDNLLKLLSNQPELKIEIYGHTDSDGSDESNLKLSEDRAKSVVAYLVSKGVKSDRLSAKGLGETKPAAPNTSPENKAINRRVEFKVL